jgi:hypothetical protein
VPCRVFKTFILALSPACFEGENTFSPSNVRVKSEHQTVSEWTKKKHRPVERWTRIEIFSRTVGRAERLDILSAKTHWTFELTLNSINEEELALELELVGWRKGVLMGNG